MILILIAVAVYLLVLRKKKGPQDEEGAEAQVLEPEPSFEVAEPEIMVPEIVVAEPMEPAKAPVKKAATPIPAPAKDGGFWGQKEEKGSPSIKLNLEVSSVDELMGDEDDPYKAAFPASSAPGQLALPPAQIFDSNFAKIAKIDELFVINKDGLLLRHFTYVDTTMVDKDVLSGMLTVIQNFVADSFGGKGTLKELKLGDYHILICTGKELSIVAISSAGKLDSLEKPITKMIGVIEEQNKDVWDSWDGTLDSLKGISENVNMLVKGEYSE
jgi:hypothetical protein